MQTFLEISHGMEITKRVSSADPVWWNKTRRPLWLIGADCWEKTEKSREYGARPFLGYHWNSSINGRISQRRSMSFGPKIHLLKKPRPRRTIIFDIVLQRRCGYTSPFLCEMPALLVITLSSSQAQGTWKISKMKLLRCFESVVVGVATKEAEK